MHTTAWFKMMAVAAVLGCASVAPAPAKEAGPNPNIGKPAPELKIKDWAAGKGVTQAELKGRPYVLEFWATWCPPCRKSIPHLVELAQRVMPLGMNVIGLSDEDITKVRPFAEKNNMIYQVGVNNGMKGLEFEGIPFAAVIAKSGKVIWAGHPMEAEFEAAVYKALTEFRPTWTAYIELAKANKLGALHAELAKAADPEAKAGAERLAAFAAQQLDFASAAPATTGYPVLRRLIEVYAGMPVVEKATQKLADMRQDPVVGKQIDEKEQLDAFEAQLDKLRNQAQAQAQAGKAEAEVTHEFMLGVAAALEGFVKAHPTHPQADELKKGLDEVKAELAKVKPAAEEPKKP